MANLTNAIAKNKVNFKPVSLGSDRDRRIANIIVGLTKLDWKLIGFGTACFIAVGFFWVKALINTGVL